jgi:FkbM family methyltransferase
MKKIILSVTSLLARILPAGIKKWIYNQDLFARFIRGALNRAAPIGYSEVTVSAGELAGLSMRLDLQTEKDYWLGTYETDLQRTVRELVKPGWIAYDVGANIGYITLLFSRVVGETGKVFSFEALPENLERLHNHIAMNDLTLQVAVVPEAVAAASEPIRFYVGPSGAMGKAEGSAGRDENFGDSFEVSGIALDDFIFAGGNPPPNVIKMDIEGGEILALQGMSRILSEIRPLILMELHGPEAAQVAWNTLKAANYSIHRMSRGYPIVNSLDELDWKSYLVARP